MRNFISILCFLLISSSITFSQEKKVKVDGVIYVVDINKGTASVSSNYNNRKSSSMKGDIIIASNVTLKKIKYPVTRIEDSAFLGCDAINSITISISVNEIEYWALTNIQHLNQILVESGNLNFQSKDGILYSADFKKLVRYPSDRKDTTFYIPSTVNTIGKGAFLGCWYLRNIEIPNSVVQIEKEPFIVSSNSCFCSNLVSVTYQNKELTFPSNTFLNWCKLSKRKIIYEAPTALFLELAQKGNPEDQYKLAMCYLTEDDFPKDVKAAKEWFMKASEYGHAPSQKALGDIYFSGIGVDKNFEEAIKWYSLATKGGNAPAQSALGDCYFQGAGVKKDFSTAINYYKLAANQGDSKAEKVLGYCYYYGDGGINKDYKEAVKWYGLSANKGNAEAAYYLSICYSEGQGIDKNNSEALKWIEKAVEGGIEKGQGLYCVLVYDDAITSLNSKNYSLAILKITSLLKYDKNNIEAYINRGYCYLNLQVKDYPSAEKDFKKALELDSKNITAKNNLQVVTDYFQRIKDAKNLCDEGDKYYNQKDYTNAVACYSKSISLDSSKPYSYYLIGYCYFNCTQYADAIKYFDQALSIDPNYTDAIKARKNAKTILMLNALSGALTTVSNSLSNAYNSSSNYSSSPSYSSTSNSSSSISSTKRKCGFCDGTRECPYCNSAGQSKACLNSFGQACSDSYCIDKNHLCKDCGGTHVCSNCKGTGYK